LALFFTNLNGCNVERESVSLPTRAAGTAAVDRRRGKNVDPHEFIPVGSSLCVHECAVSLWLRFKASAHHAGRSMIVDGKTIRATTAGPKKSTAAAVPATATSVRPACVTATTTAADTNCVVRAASTAAAAAAAIAATGDASTVS
jgi:hypothetical protein